MLETGFTADDKVHLVKKLGAENVVFAFLVELVNIEGQKKLEGCAIHSLMTYT